jgi:pimeloyl-ACP methyl ester carboxylesterase
MADGAVDMLSKQAQTGWVKVSGRENVRLATEVMGSGQDFVWGHSLLGSMAQDEDGGVFSWRELTDIARVIRYDARGHGLSGSAGEPEDFRWDNLARTMWQVVDSFGAVQVVLGGASMGCATSLHAACQRPEQVKGLVLVIPPTAWQLREKMKRNYRIAANIVKLSRGLPFRLLGLVKPRQGRDDFQKNMLSTMAGHLVKVDYRGVVGAMRGAALSDLPPRSELAKLDMPVLILAWPDDVAHPLAVAEELNSILPNSQLQVLREPGDPYHWPELLRQFFTSLN